MLSAGIVNEVVAKFLSYCLLFHSMITRVKGHSPVTVMACSVFWCIVEDFALSGPMNFKDLFIFIAAVKELHECLLLFASYDYYVLLLYLKKRRCCNQNALKKESKYLCLYFIDVLI